MGLLGPYLVQEDTEKVKNNRIEAQDYPKSLKVLFEQQNLRARVYGKRSGVPISVIHERRDEI